MTKRTSRAGRATKKAAPRRFGAKRAASVRRRTPEEAKLEIVAAARKYLLKKSFRTLTIEKLMKTTQVGRSAFYAYFANVYDLAEIFIHELAGGVEDVVEDWLSRDGDPALQLRAAFSNGLAFWEPIGPLIRNLHDAALQDDRLEKIWRDKVATGPILRIADKIRRDQAAGLIGPMDPLQMSIALNLFNLNYLNDCFGKGKTRDKDVILQTMERIWIGALYGTSPPP
jgi:AcrR family transcriptional regulator